MVCRPASRRDGDERDAAPDVGGDQGQARVPGRAQEVDVGLAPAQHVDQEVGDDRELRVVDPPEGQGREHGRHDEGDQDDGAQERFERQVLVEHQRQPQAQRELSDGGQDRVEQGVEHGQAEHRVGEQPDVVVEPDELARTADGGVGEGEPDAQAQGVGEEQDQDAQGGQQAQEDQERLAVERPREPADARAWGCRSVSAVAAMPASGQPSGREAAGRNAGGLGRASGLVVALGAALGFRRGLLGRRLARRRPRPPSGRRRSRPAPPPKPRRDCPCSRPTCAVLTARP